MRNLLCMLALLAFTACASRSPSDEQESALDGELATARAATERFQRPADAIAAGYEDINVIMPQMGHHYMRPAHVDAHFDPAHPEILVYAPRNGELRLVAVEYAVPLSLAESAPEGFTGSSDVWTRSEQFQLWLLHAWIWLDNPAGVFSPTNANVQ